MISETVEPELRHDVEFGTELPYSLAQREWRGSSDSGASDEYAITPPVLKRLNREVSKKIPESEKKRLMIEHLELVKKDARTGLEKSEKRRLQLIRWQLDNIEDAEHGEDLDRLEAVLKAKERFAEEIEKLVGQFKVSKHRRHKPRALRSKA